MHVYRINAVGKDGRPVVLGTFDTASSALVSLQEAFVDYRRAWVTDDKDEDVDVADLMRKAQDEQNAQGPQS